MKNRRGKHYYKRILLTLLVVSLMPVLFLGYYVYSFVDLQMDTIYKSYATGLENEKEEFETTFQYVDAVMIRLGLKTVCQNAVNRERVASNFQIFNTMQEELQLIANTENYLEDVYLVSQIHNWVLGGTSFQSLTDSENGKSLDPLLEHKESSFWESSGKDLYLCKKVPVNTANGTGMLIAQFDTGAMVEAINGKNSEGTLLVLDQDNHRLFGPDSDAPLWQVALSPGSFGLAGGETGIQKLRFAEESYVLLQSVSEYSGWNYMLLIPTTAIDQSTRSVFWAVGLVMLGFLAVNCVIIILFSRRLYLPIGEIDSVVEDGMRHTEGKETEIPENAGIIDRLQYIFLKNAEMNQRLKHDRRDGQQLFLRRVYQGEIIDPGDKLFQETGLLEEGVPEGTIFVLAMKYYSVFEEAGDQQLYAFALDNIISELINPKEAFPLVIIGSLMYLTCFVKTGSDESAVMKVQMQAIMIITTVKKYLNQSLNIGVSQGFANMSGITRAIEQSTKALQNAMGAEGEVNLYHSNHSADDNARGYAQKKKRVALLHAIDIGEKEICRKDLNEYIQGLSNLPYYVFKLEICKLVSEILNIYSDYQLVPDYDKVGDIIDFDITKTVNTSDRLKAYLWEHLLDPLFSVICNQAKERDMMQQIVEYLMDHLEQDISLEECARHFNYNANYLSRWFKKKMGMTYTDFVTNKKIDLCKSLLVESDISVNELAERFGYSSPQNFIRVFKKFVLLTPGQYRKIEKEKKEKFSQKD